MVRVTLSRLAPAAETPVVLLGLPRVALPARAPLHLPVPRPAVPLARARVAPLALLVVEARLPVAAARSCPLT